MTLASMGLLVLVLNAASLQGQPMEFNGSLDWQPNHKSTAATSNPRLNADPALNHLITGLVLAHLPHRYAREKDWGKQEEMFDGIKLRREGWRLETKRKKKLVNHGTWRKYSAELLDPQKKFSVKVANVRQTPNEQLAFDVNFTTHLKLFARQSKWLRGVQLYSVSADGRAAVRLNINFVMDIKLDPQRFPPDLIFAPAATRANLQVDEFRIDRVSKLGGEFAQQVTRAARRELDDEIAEKEIELVKKINKELRKNQQHLRLSVADALTTQWTQMALPHLSPTIKSALDRD